MTDDGGVIRRLFPQVQPYAWGSLTAMTELLDIPSTGGPMAELWLGDHPLLPSFVASAALSSSGTADERSGESDRSSLLASRPNSPLNEVLTANPSAWFDSAGIDETQIDATSTRPGTSLRFLLKVMAIAEPLSLQTHPNLDQARAGFAREEALGIGRTASNRNYRDPNHKPELICALTEMDALSGFRPIAETVALLRLVRDPAADFLRSSLAGGLDATMRSGLSGAVFPDVHATKSFALAARDAAARHRENALTFEWWAALCERHPGDGGIAVATLLHCVRLQPGQALFLGAGNMHAYLSGVGIEIMANSDNVLRGGLTPKHVDIEELLSVTNAVAGPLPLVTPLDVSSQILGTQNADLPFERIGWICEEWPVPVDDFRLLRVCGHSSDPCSVQINTRPLIALCTEGELRLAQGDRSAQAITLKRGESAIAGNSENPLSLSGRGTMFLASAG
jgi:mannose-6-phosphate isomerase